MIVACAREVILVMSTILTGKILCVYVIQLSLLLWSLYDKGTLFIRDSYICVCTCTCTCTCMYVHMCMHMYICTYVHVHMCVCVYWYNV